MKHHPSFAILMLVLLSLAISAGLSGTATAAPAGTPPPPLPPDASPEEASTLEDVESAYKPSYVKLATGNPLAVSAARAREIAEATGMTPATHATYAWPFNISFTMGHAIQSYQNYGSGTSSAYFHHGIDIMATNGTAVYNRSGGQVVNVENYQPGNVLYWEVAVLDPEGYIWQYHHIDNTTIPQAIRNAFAAYQADPVNGGFIAPDTYVGNVVYWTVVSFGYRFNHIHLNILAAGGVYLNGFDFMQPLNDTTAPVIQAIGLLKNNTVTAGNTISGDYGLYVRAKDLVLSPVYYLPPYEVDFSVDGGPATPVWQFANLPGGASDTAYVNDYYVAPPTCGNYTCREFYVDLGFTTAGERVFPACNGSHTINVTAYDYAGNSASGAFTWTVTGCAAPAAVSDLRIAGLDAAQVQLDWSAAAAAVQYQVWWNAADPYFVPAAYTPCTAANGCATTAATTFTHDGLGDTGNNYSYLVRPVSECGCAQAAPSNRAGDFDFRLVPGTP